MQSTRFLDQVRRNSVALISLVIAIASLSYNSWRNEASEDNRTQRAVAIEMLLQLAELQELVWRNHYDHDTENEGNLRRGWTLVITIRDVATVLNAPLPETARMLHEVWGPNSARLGQDETPKQAIIDAIEECRGDILVLLQELS